jgi:hypothetical protein
LPEPPHDDAQLGTTHDDAHDDAQLGVGGSKSADSESDSDGLLVVCVGAPSAAIEADAKGSDELLEEVVNVTTRLGCVGQAADPVRANSWHTAQTTAFPSASISST